jgi:hypothetical protein
MLRRLTTLALVLALLAPASAMAQSNDLLPPTAASPTITAAPTATPATTTSSNSSTGRTTLLIIGVAILVSFVGIGLWIARDARRSLRQDTRRHGSTAEPMHADGTPRPRSPQAKEKARAKGRRQRRARRHNRPAR